MESQHLVAYTAKVHPILELARILAYTAKVHPILELDYDAIIPSDIDFDGITPSGIIHWHGGVAP